MTPRFFRSAVAFHRWLAQHHESARALWVGFHHRDSGKGGITYPEALDEALCVGWIDGLRRNVDASSYMIRFTPRKPKSHWSAVNVRHVARLTAEERMQPSGIAAFERRGSKTGYSYEERPQRLGRAYEKRLKANTKAWAFFQQQPPWYRRNAAFWVVSAKKEETRERRLAALIRHSARGEPIPPLGGPTGKQER